MGSRGKPLIRGSGVSGVATAPADPAMRGGPLGLGGPNNIRKTKKKKKGPHQKGLLGPTDDFLRGGPESEATPLSGVFQDNF